MNILIVKMSAIGDVVHTLPVLCVLGAHHPGAHIAWLVEESAREVVEGHRAVDRVLVSHRKTWARDARAGHGLRALGGARRFARDLRDTRYDLLIDLQGLLKSSVWILLARARRKAGFGRGMEHAEGSWIALNERVPAVDMDIHALDRGLLLLEALGVPRGPTVYDFPVTDENEAEAASLLAVNGIEAGEPFVAVHPVATWPTKLWTTARFAEVADRLVESGRRVAFTGSPGDRPVLDEIEKQMRRPLARLDGRTGLKTLAAVYRRAGVVLSTDTGPMHLAAAMGTPVVALFGPTAPWRTGPHGAGHAILRVELNCSPCFRRTCTTKEYEKMACMKRIDVDRVVEAVLARG